MNRFKLSLMAFAWMCAITPLRSQEPPTAPVASSSEIFMGSTPYGERMKMLFQISAAEHAPLSWNLTLRRNQKTQTPAGYTLECRYVLAAASGPTKQTIPVKRQGVWTTTKGTKSNPEAIVIELDQAFSLLQVSENVLHVLETDRSLMVGNGGYSYTLNRRVAAEMPGDVALALARASVSYTNSPLSSGPSVFGIFEGRSPCRGIARELKRQDDAGCIKAKWRVTLLQNPDTKIPTTYKVEGSIYRGHTREGAWSILRGAHVAPDAVVYRLDATSTEPHLDLLKGDDDVLFFLNQDGQPMVGHAAFSYTLNRRSAVPAPLTPNFQAP